MPQKNVHIEVYTYLKNNLGMFQVRSTHVYNLYIFKTNFVRVVRVSVLLIL